MTAAPGGRDRLRALLDSVLDEERAGLVDMAHAAFSSPFHFSREVSRLCGEPPATMRRRVLLERAAWRLHHGWTVTDAALEAGYDSVDGFARAFTRCHGTAPSRAATGRWRLPTPNGIHFHPPLSLWVDDRSGRSARPGQTMGDVTLLMVRHDVDDIRGLLDAARGMSRSELLRVRCEDAVALSCGARDETILGLLEGLVTTREQWLAAICGDDTPVDRSGDAVADLADRHEAAGARWLGTVADIERRGAWGDRLIDALCDPPETFVLGGVLAHVLTFSAARRLLARRWLRHADALPTPSGPGADDADPLVWLAHHTEDTPWR